MTTNKEAGPQTSAKMPNQSYQSNGGRVPDRPVPFLDSSRRGQEAFRGLRASLQAAARDLRQKTVNSGVIQPVLEVDDVVSLRNGDRNGLTVLEEVHPNGRPHFVG